MWRIFLSLAALIVLSGPLAAQDKKVEFTDAEKKAVATIRAHIDQMKFGQGAGEVIAQTAADVKKSFPDHQLVIVRFRQFPVARIMPEGLRSSNIFVVKANKIEYLKDVKTLESFFRSNAPAAKNEQSAKSVLAAWLSLTQEFHQDGMFKFDVREKEFVIDSKDGFSATVSGSAIVMAGGNGELKATLQIDKDGKLAKVAESAKIRPGPRPICQATKLLDADPLVRRICEQDLLVMGLSAREYLMEQRERATPELREAIDRVWLQILKNGW